MTRLCLRSYKGSDPETSQWEVTWSIKPPDILWAIMLRGNLSPDVSAPIVISVLFNLPQFALRFRPLWCQSCLMNYTSYFISYIISDEIFKLFRSHLKNRVWRFQCQTNNFWMQNLFVSFKNWHREDVNKTFQMFFFFLRFQFPGLIFKISRRVANPIHTLEFLLKSPHVLLTTTEGKLG